ncbi:MAG TPA: alpha-E domain-containing protein [Anaerolineae bacterium]|nr:alpha-E domain-containing protein [Anaerolineae bacterium]HMR66292.1 alpha-E domain-containing protein [Anaerolineae bacterium]
MLSRVADHLYWMSRYLERAEHAARLIDVQLYRRLDQSPAFGGSRWERLAACLRVSLPDEDLRDDYKTIQALTFDDSNPGSLISCLASARENARNIRSEVSSEMYEELNQLYLSIRQARQQSDWLTAPHDIFQLVKDGAYLFQGITDTTMNHGEGWHFIHLGRYLERASSLARLLDVHFSTFSTGPNETITSDDYLEWVGLLNSCTAFEAYRKVYTADATPRNVAEFLLLNPEFPHSVCFSIEKLQQSLDGIAVATEMKRVGGVFRVVGRLRAALGFDQVDEIIREPGLHEYLIDVQKQCVQIHDSLYRTFINYSAEAALAA